MLLSLIKLDEAEATTTDANKINTLLRKITLLTYRIAAASINDIQQLDTANFLDQADSTIAGVNNSILLNKQLNLRRYLIGEGIANNQIMMICLIMGLSCLGATLIKHAEVKSLVYSNLVEHNIATSHGPIIDHIINFINANAQKAEGKNLTVAYDNILATKAKGNTWIYPTLNNNTLMIKQAYYINPNNNTLEVI